MYDLNSIYHGFKLIEEAKIDEISSIARVFEHVKSGARLLHLENGDDNKVFSISFRTTPKNDTGVPHILEHAVLCGSKKFRTKDVFTDMAKSSLNTFINAMTFPDRTSYPIASRNHKDFFNLMEVYLDAVFYPNIYENHELLRQEGWRYEFEEETDKLVYKGIVYSEMQGALSSPEEVLACNIYSSLFPNTTYAFNSGGDPEAIPNLTQEEFENFHNKFYHPSNSYIYLYGDQDLNECLRVINEEYLMNFDRIDIPSHIEDAKPFEDMMEKTAYYSISEDEEENNKTYMALSFACEETKNSDTYLPMKILNNMLVDSSSSPIRKALLDAGIGENMLTYNELGVGFVKRTIFNIAVNNTNEEKKEEFKKIVFDTLKSLVKNGIDRKLIEASINFIEFELREADFWGSANKGMVYSLTVMDSWLYDESPILHLRYEDKLKEIKKEIENNYFEKFIERYILSNNQSSLVILKPQKGLDKIKTRKLEEKLNEYKKSLGENEIKALKERNAMLKQAQMKENTPEEIATLPKLSLNEISKEVEKIPQILTERDGVKILSHNIRTNKVSYINLLFDASVIEEKYVPYLGLLRDILGKTDTGKKSYSELNTEIFRKTGGIDFKIEDYIVSKNYDKCQIKFIVKSKVLSQNIEELCILINEILTLSKFDNGKRIKEVIQETKSKLKRYIVNAGNRIAMIRAGSCFSKAKKYMDMVRGAQYYEFLCEIEKSFDEKYNEIEEALIKVYKSIFNKNNLIISFTGEEEYFKNLTSNLGIILNNLTNENVESFDISFQPSNRVEAIITSTNVQYVVKAFNCNKFGYSYSGKMKVLQNILDCEYLYPRVRLNGGAYGCYMSLDNSGNIYFYSYRDPNLMGTIETYNEADLFIKEIDYPLGSMENFIIGAVGQLEKPLTQEAKGDSAVKNYICGITNEDIQKEKDELLSTSIEDIKNFANMIKKGMEENCCCVVGNEMKIADNKEVFNIINTLL